MAYRRLIPVVLFGAAMLAPAARAMPEANRVAFFLNKLYPVVCRDILAPPDDDDLVFRSTDIITYQAATVEEHRARAEAVGLSGTPELDAAFGTHFPRFVPYAHHFPEDWPGGLPRRVIEIGAGGGRVVDWLIDVLPPSTEIHAVEYASRVAIGLRERYEDVSNVSIHEEPFEQFRLPRPAQVAFALFSIFWDMDRAEKHRFFAHAAELLGDLSALVLDVRLPEDFQEAEGMRTVASGNGQTYLYSPSYNWWLHTADTRRILDLAALHGFTLGRSLYYETTRQRRVLYVFVRGLA